MLSSSTTGAGKCSLCILPVFLITYTGLLIYCGLFIYDLVESVTVALNDHTSNVCPLPNVSNTDLVLNNCPKVNPRFGNRFSYQELDTYVESNARLFRFIGPVDIDERLLAFNDYWQPDWLWGEAVDNCFSEGESVVLTDPKLLGEHTKSSVLDLNYHALVESY
jgi:hypothetical protein